MVVFFESKVTVNRKTYLEVKKHLLSQDLQATHSVAFWFCLIILIGGIVGAIIFRPLLVIPFGGLLALIAQRVRYLDDIHRAIKEYQGLTGGKEGELTTFFMDDEININQTNGGDTVKISYDRITRFVESENLYVLFAKANRIVFVNKESLLQEQKSDEFIQFIKHKCKNLKCVV